jgi:hypothetical protein
LSEKIHLVPGQIWFFEMVPAQHRHFTLCAICVLRGENPPESEKKQGGLRLMVSASLRVDS